MTKVHFLLFGLAFAWLGCKDGRWSEEKRQQFKADCLETETFTYLGVIFNGFANDEFDSVLVREFRDSTFLDSFKVFVWPAESPYEIEHKRRFARITRTINVHHRYQFIIPNQKPFELTNMKMIMWPQFTETSEGYGCRMGDYTIDGVRFEHNANPTFVKR